MHGTGSPSTVISKRCDPSADRADSGNVGLEPMRCERFKRERRGPTEQHVGDQVAGRGSEPDAGTLVTTRVDQAGHPPMAPITGR